MAPPFMTEHATRLPTGEHEMSSSRTHAPVLVAALCAACALGNQSGVEPEPAAPAFAWELPPGFPAPSVPPDNPMSPQKVELGRRLFYDKRLSGNGTFSCASCHVQALAFTDGRATAIGSTGQLHPRELDEPRQRGVRPDVDLGKPADGRARAPGARAAVRRRARRARSPLDRADRGAAARRRALSNVVPRRLPRSRGAGHREQHEQGARRLPAHADLGPFGVRPLVLRGRRKRDVRSGAAWLRPVRRSSPRLLPLPRRLQLQRSHTRSGRSPDPKRRITTPGSTTSTAGGTYPAPNTGVHEVTQNPADMGRFKAPTLAQHRGDGALHARRQHRDARPRCWTTTPPEGARSLEGPYAGNGSRTRSRASG